MINLKRLDRLLQHVLYEKSYSALSQLAVEQAGLEQQQQCLSLSSSSVAGFTSNMGVNNLWKALGSAVQTLEGHNAGQHAEIVDAVSRQQSNTCLLWWVLSVRWLMLVPLQVENKVVAVDLSAWLMQAQSQPALLEHYDSPYARAAKVVFDRVSSRCC